MTKYRIRKTNAAKVYERNVLESCGIPVSETMYVVESRNFSFVSWKHERNFYNSTDAEEYILVMKGEHPSQLEYKNARNQPDDIVGEY